MELETVKNRLVSLKQERKDTKTEIEKLIFQKIQKEQEVQNLQEEFSRLEQKSATKDDEIRKYETAVEIMEL